jgi:putative ABC transport system permease protein
MFKAMLRGLFAHKLRLLLSALAIVLGTMFMSAAFVAGDTISKGFSTLFATISEDLDVTVTATPPEAGGFDNSVITRFVPQATADEVAKVDGVAVSTPQVFSDGARVIDKNGKVAATQGAPRFGAGWVGDAGLIELREGRGPTSPTEVAISANLAGSTGFVIGDTIEVITLQPRQPFTVVGITGYEGDRESLGGETTVYFTTPRAQELMLGETGVYTSVDLLAADGVSPDTLADRVRSVVGPGYDVKTGQQAADDQASSVQTVVNFLKIGLAVFAVIGMITGAFLIFNTFSMLVAQRTRELALYRSFGASRGQVNRSVLAEALLLGLAASLVGLLLGVGIGWVLKTLVGRLGGDLPVAGVVLRPYVVVTTLLVGTLFTVLAALAPAVRASRVAPIEAMRSAATPDKPLRRMTIAGAVLLAGGLLLLILKFTDVIEGQLGPALGGGALLVFLGAVLLAPMLSRPVTGGLGRLLGRSVPSRLGTGNTGRNPRRTAITAVALMLGVALATAAGLFASSLKAGLTEAFTTDVKAQLVVSAGFTGSPQAGFDPQLEERMRAIPGVATAAAVRADFGTVGGGETQFLAGDPQALAALLTLRAASGELRPLDAGEIIIDSGTADRTGAQVGDTVPITTARGGEQQEKVVAVLEESAVVSGPLLNPVDAAGFTSPLAQGGYIEVADGQNVGAVKTQLDQLLADYPEVSVSSQQELIEQSTSFLDILLTVLNVLLGLTIVVAVLGVINTLLLSVYERTREIGLIRAIGLSRRSTAWMITAESILISVFGALLGVIVGVGLGLATVKILGGDFLKLTIPWGYLGIVLILAVIAGVVAAILPAIRAARLNVLEAIAYE